MTNDQGGSQGEDEKVAQDGDTGSGEHFTTETIDAIVDLTRRTEPRLVGEEPTKVVALVNEDGLAIALLRDDNSLALLVHPDTYAEMAGVSREEVDRRIVSGEIPLLSEEDEDPGTHPVEGRDTCKNPEKPSS